MSGKVWAVLTAAGSGSRLGASTPKALVRIGGQTLLECALSRLLALPNMAGIAVTCPDGYLEEFSRAGGLASDPEETEVAYVVGGPSRQASVKAGLDALTEIMGETDRETNHDVVLVHDAARALAPTSLMRRLTEAVQGGLDAVIPGLSVTDTIKQVALDRNGNEVIVATPDRSSLRVAQTPQAFRWPILLDSHVRAQVRSLDEATAATDDAVLVEEFGTVVGVIPGDENAFKVTVPADVARAESVLALQV